MSGFKLIAIRPLLNCDPKFLKVLNAGELYQFYNEFKFNFIDGNKENDVETIDYIPSVPEDLYDVGNLKVNISAVVGKNGSGKSSLLELLYICLYKIGIDSEILANWDFYDRETKNEHTFPNDLIKKIDQYEDKIGTIPYDTETNKIEREEIEIILKHYRDEKDKIQKEFDQNKKDNFQYSSEIKAINKGLNIELYYSVDNVIYQIEISDGKSFHSPLFDINNNEDTTNIPSKITRKFKLEKIKRKILNKENIILLQELFYSIVLNYATHGLNSNHLGLWIKKLFHKNDGYQTPIVLNPMRDEGNYDINEENERAINRLLHNILLQKKENPSEKIFITDNQFVLKVRIRFDKQYKISDRIKEFDKSGIKSDPQVMAIISGLQRAFYPQNLSSQLVLFDANFLFSDSILGYIVNKFFKIIDTYIEYQGLYNPTIDNYGLSDELIKKFKNDQSHIVFKLRQAFNFVLSVENLSPSTSKWMKLKKKSKAEDFVDFQLKELLDSINCEKSEELINYLPPAIFSFDIVLSSDENSKNIPTTFSALSSGEQQMIHSINSVLYHLLNLNSVHNGGDSRIAFKSVNIIFDEIELYFHPDYQRKFIDQLLKAIDRLKLGKDSEGITSLNILFSTHSPFILSDIPSSNILRLAEGKPQHNNEANETFGANVHDLLADSFFLDKGFMGEFVKNKVNESIAFLNISKLQKKINELKKQKEKEQNHLEAENIDSEIKKSEEDLQFLLKISDINPTNWPDNQPPQNLIEYYLQIIKLIGEPVLRNKLESMYNDLFQNEDEKKKQFEQLARELGAQFKYK